MLHLKCTTEQCKAEFKVDVVKESEFYDDELYCCIYCAGDCVDADD